MTQVFSIPLLPQSQTLSVQLAGVNYTLALNWNGFSKSWTLDIFNAQGRILSGMPLVANVDLLEQYGYMNFGGELIAATVGQRGVPPTYDNLGSAGQLYFVIR